MKVILATHNYYLEYGLRLLLKEYRVILAADLFRPENRRNVLKHDESWLIICDRQLGRLMSSMFLGRHFMQLNVETLKGIQDIHNAVHNGLWSWNTAARTLTMSEMMVMFGYIYHQLRPCRLASDMGIKIKTVNSFLYSGLVKNGLESADVRLLAIDEGRREQHYPIAAYHHNSVVDFGYKGTMRYEVAASVVC
ncbi:hypothetical protein ACUV95_004901 [Escherichia coli]|uniref:hypothetical protein n=1 Tax=Escherichia sp. MOD1-EC7003 TaxID=2093900 RepID=UPI001F5477B4|nr:hypothetical protein [Escherichia sp. MOD1-EC7003]